MLKASLALIASIMLNGCHTAIPARDLVNYDGRDAQHVLTSPLTSDEWAWRAFTTLVGDLPAEDPKAYLLAASDTRLSDLRRQQVRCAYLRRQVVPWVSLRKVLADAPEVASWFTEPLIRDANSYASTPVGPGFPPSCGVYVMALPHESDPRLEAPRAYIVLSRFIERDELLQMIRTRSVPGDVNVLLVSVAK